MLFRATLVIFVDLKIILGVIVGGTISTIFHLKKPRCRGVGNFSKAMQLSLGLIENNNNNKTGLLPSGLTCVYWEAQSHGLWFPKHLTPMPCQGEECEL